MGADRFGPRFIKSLPESGRQTFVDLLDEREEKVAWPWQGYIILVCLLAKKVTSERPDFPCDHALPHLESQGKHFAAEWCDAKAGFWDDAV